MKEIKSPILEKLKKAIDNKNWEEVESIQKEMAEILTEPLKKPGPLSQPPKEGTGTERAKKKRKYTKKSKIILPTQEDVQKVEESNEPREPIVRRDADGRIAPQQRIFTKLPPIKVLDARVEPESKKNLKYFNSLKPSPRRDKVVMGKATCIKCNRKVTMPADEAAAYGTGKEGDERPTFDCDSCLR